MTEKTREADVRENLQTMFDNAKQYRLIITSRHGGQWLNIPLLMAIILVVLAPKLAILAAIVAFFTRTRIRVVTPDKRKSHDIRASQENRPEAA